MKIGVVSDTHRNTADLDRVVDWLISTRHIASLYHLGDDYEDAAGYLDADVEVIRVPGIYDERYRNGLLMPKQIDTVLGLRILLVHSLEKDITRDDKLVSDIILYGHTHKPELKLEDGLLLMNPGHLKSSMDKQVKPSFGLLDIQDRSVSAKIIGLDFEEINNMDLIRAENGLFRA